MNKRNSKLAEDALIQSGGALGGVIVGAVIGGPPGAYIGSVVGPVVTSVVKGLIGPKEKERVERVHELAKLKYIKLSEKSLLRKDISYEKLTTLIEGTLLSARSSYEEKKVPLLANLVAVAPFTNTPIDNLNQTLNQAERMTYRQLCLLAIVERNHWKGELELSSRPFYQEESKKNHELSEGVYQDLNLMIVDGTLGMTSDDGKSIMMSSGVGYVVPARLIPMYAGRLLINGLDLYSIPDTDLKPLIQVLK